MKRFNFEALLREHFGLTCGLYNGKDYDDFLVADAEAEERGDDVSVWEVCLTKEGDEAWTRAERFIDALKDAEIISKDVWEQITDAFREEVLTHIELGR